MLFHEPQGLPPMSSNTHRIHLLPNTPLVNVRLYRYPYFQKNEIEKLLNEMLRSGIIRPRTSAFSSLVLLIKKKKKRWDFSRFL